MKINKRIALMLGCLSLFTVLGSVNSAYAGDTDSASEQEKLREKQKQIQRNFMKLVKSIKGAAKAIKKTEPETSQRLEETLVELEKLKITDQMDEVIKYISSKGKYQLSDKVKKLVKDLELVMNLLTLDRTSLDKMAIQKVIKQIKDIKKKQAKVNDAKEEGKDTSKEQKALREAVENAAKELEKVSKESPYKKATEEAKKDLEEAKKAMEEAEKGGPNEGQPSEPKEGQSEKSKEAEKKLKEALEKLEEAKKKLENVLKEGEENPDDIIEAIREELKRMIVIQNKTQDMMKGSVEKKTSKRALKKKLKSHKAILEQQTEDMKKLELGFKEEGSITFEMAMGMIIEDEASLIEDFQSSVCNDISLIKGQNVIDGLEDMLKALEDLDPIEGGTWKGGKPWPMGKQEGLPGIAQIVLAHLMQTRNLKNTKTANAMKKGVKNKNVIVGQLEVRQKKIDKVLNKAIEAIKAGDKVK